MSYPKLLKRFSTGVSLTALAALGCSPALAQDGQDSAERESGLNVIVVTATKRSEDLQDVPVAVQALGSDQLDQLNVQNFSDYLTQLPNVSAGGGNPGQSTIYIRGLASTTPNLTSAGVAGLAPNVALYLNDQPVSQPGRNLDVYAADLERIEVLSGPQGTLFGASSQAGTVRLITNKPDLGGFGAKVSGGVSFTKGGETSYNVQAMLNVPVTDSIALRGVVFLDDQGGYIDNVAGTRTVREGGRFRPVGTVRENGLPVSANRAGFQSTPAALAQLDANTTFRVADNAGLVEDNFNDTQYSGFRITGLWEIAPGWNFSVAHMRQSLESDGVFFTDPNLNDLEIQRFEEDRLQDDFSNTSWTLEGRIGALEMVYTGAYTDRETSQRVDYSDYLFVGQYVPYYICDTAVVYPGYVANAPANPTCQAPNLFVNSFTNTTVFTQELRFNTPSDARIRATFGGFYSDLTLEERNDFHYLSQLVRGSDGVTEGFLPNFPLTNINAPPGQAGNASDGFFTDPGPFPSTSGFRNDIRRTDEQFGIFGEVSFDIIPDRLTIVGGARYYDVKVDFEGSANSSFFNLRSPVFGPNTGVPLAQRQDAQLGGANLSSQFGPNSPVGAPDTASTDGFIFKGTINWRPYDDTLLYVTYSEGFRPGLLNRPGGAQGPNGFVVPFSLDTDDVRNYEFGWKTQGFDNQLRFNGNFFFVDISKLQTTIFDPSITNLFFSDNAANAEIKGVEADFQWAPYSVPGLTVAGAFSALDTEITQVLTPTNDVTLGGPLAFAPDFQGNLRVRYEWEVFDGFTAHIMPQVTYSDKSFTDIIEINKLELDSWTTFGLSAGITNDEWSFEIFGENLTDERAQVSGNFIFDRQRIIVNRPLTVGARFSFTY